MKETQDATDGQTNSGPDVQQLTPEHMCALISLAIHKDGDLAAKSLAALVNAVAGINDPSARDEMAITIIEQAYKSTDEYNDAVMSFAQRDAFGRRSSM